MIGPTDLFHPSPAPHFKTFQVFLICCPKRILLYTFCILPYTECIQFRYNIIGYYYRNTHTYFFRSNLPNFPASFSRNSFCFKSHISFIFCSSFLFLSHTFSSIFDIIYFSPLIHSVLFMISIPVNIYFPICSERMHSYTAFY